MTKRILITALWIACLACAGQATAQHYVGVRAGYGGGMTRVFPPEENGLVWGLYSAGVSWKYYSHERYVGGVQADVEFLQRAFKRELYYPSLPYDTVSYIRHINSVMVPLIWQPHFYFFSRTVRVYINLGLTFSYNIDSRFEWRLQNGNRLVEKGPYEMRLTRDNRFGYGLMGGAGIGYLFGRFEVQAEGRYHFGYADILRNRNRYEENPLRSPLDNINISVGVYYRLGKGGILAPPSRQTIARIRQRNERRAAARQSFETVLPVLEENRQQQQPIINPDTGKPFTPQGEPIRLEDLPDPSQVRTE